MDAALAVESHASGIGSFVAGDAAIVGEPAWPARVPGMRIDFSNEAIEAGLSNGPDTAHNSKTMMLPELRALLGAVRSDADPAEYREAAVDLNVMDKATVSTRVKTFHYLRKLYILDRSKPTFAALRELWALDPVAQPLLALLSALARDPGLRATAEAVLELQPGDMTGPRELAAAIEEAFPGRYNPSVRHHIGQNAGATWKQAGLLVGTLTKTRRHPEATYPAAAYALYLGHLEGAAAGGLYSTLWTRVLDVPQATLHGLVETAARTGWLDLRAAGGMTEVSFRHLDGLTSWRGA